MGVSAARAQEQANEQPQGSGQERPIVTFILDGSNSMWSQISGEHKIASARSVISASFARHQTSYDMGLVAYGHRQANSCNDVETLLTPGQNATDQVTDALEKIKPKGATPITKALALAANHPGSANRPLRIILIADGTDNCAGDPCALAQKLTKTTPGLRIDVISFAPGKAGALEPLMCLSRATGGLFLEAANATQLASAVTTIFDAERPAPMIAVNTATQPPIPPIRRPPDARANAGHGPGNTDPERGEDIQAKLNDYADGASGNSAGDDVPSDASEANIPLAELRLSARLTEKGQELNSGIRWRVFSAQRRADEDFLLIARAQTGQASFNLPAGAYLVHITYDRATAVEKLTVPIEGLDTIINLNAGGVRLVPKLPAGLSASAAKINLSIFSAEPDDFGERPLIVPAAAPGGVVVLNAGSYYIESRYGDANAVVHADISVKAGELTEVEITHEAAEVTLKLVNEPGGEALANTGWTILTLQGEVIAEAVGAFPNQILAEGSYAVVARNDGKQFNREFSVIAGQKRDIELVAEE